MMEVWAFLKKEGFLAAWAELQKSWFWGNDNGGLRYFGPGPHEDTEENFFTIEGLGMMF